MEKAGQSITNQETGQDRILHGGFADASNDSAGLSIKLLDMANHINDIKHRDTKQLCCYLNHLSNAEKIAFVTEVVEATGINRRTFFNWKYMCCRIPDWAKSVIEKVAGERIFSPILLSNTTTENDRVAAEM